MKILKKIVSSLIKSSCQSWRSELACWQTLFLGFPEILLHHLDTLSFTLLSNLHKWMFFLDSFFPTRKLRSIVNDSTGIFPRLLLLKECKYVYACVNTHIDEDTRIDATLCWFTLLCGLKRRSLVVKRNKLSNN